MAGIHSILPTSSAQDVPTNTPEMPTSSVLGNKYFIMPFIIIAIDVSDANLVNFCNIKKETGVFHKKPA